MPALPFTLPNSSSAHTHSKSDFEVSIASRPFYVSSGPVSALRQSLQMDQSFDTPKKKTGTDNKVTPFILKSPRH